MTTANDAPRVDALEKVTGAAQYVEDLPHPPGLAFGAPIKSPYPHARIVSIDASRAESTRAVLAVLHRGNVAEYGARLKSAGTGDPSLIVREKTRFTGDLLGMVVAEDLRTARAAADLVEVEYELLPPLFSAAEALAPGAPLVHETLGTNLAFEDGLAWGDVQQGFAEADRVFEEHFFSPTVYHHPTEPVGSCLLAFADGIADLWIPTNSPFATVRDVGRLFGLPPDRVRVRVPYVGGGFGGKRHTPEMMTAFAIARKIGRPVKLVAREEESFHVGVRHAVDYAARIGVKADGRLTALDVDLLVDTGAYDLGAKIGAHNTTVSAWGCYRVPHLRVRARCAFTTKTPAIPHRGTGKTQTTYGIECAMDSVARQLGLDPVEFRRRNVLFPQENIPPRIVVHGREAPSATSPLDVDYRSLMDKVLEPLGPEGSSEPPLRRGRGVALSLRHVSKAELQTYAMATLERDGGIRVAHNAADMGQGVYTMISAVTERAMGVSRGQVRVEKPDTTNQLSFGGTNAQRTTVQMGNAVVDACGELKRAMVELAARMKGGRTEDWSINDGAVLQGDQRLSFAEVAELADAVPLRGVGQDRPPLAEDPAYGAFDQWSAGAAAADVEVDTETGEVRVLQYSIVADAGVVLHQRSAEGQVEGGAVMGFGLALCEELVHQEGQVLNADAFQYRLPLMTEIPQAMYTTFLEAGDGPGPFGAKGVSQTSIPCVAPAIGNAIHAAIGAPMRSTPFTPEKVLRALGKVT